MRSKILARTLPAATLIALLAIPHSDAESAAWTRPEGSVLFLTPTTFTFMNRQFDSDGDRVDRPKFRMVEVAPYIAYGLTDYLTLGAQPKFRHVRLDTENGTATNSGFPEADLFARLRLWSQDHAAISIQGLVKVPISPDEDNVAALGRDQVDTELKLMFGNRHDMAMGRIFYNVGLGFRKRFEEPSDEISTDGFIGWSPDGPWTFMVHSLNKIGLSNEETGTQVLTAEPDFRKHEAQLTASYRLTDTTSLTGGASTTFAGRDIGVGHSGFLSVMFAF